MGVKLPPMAELFHELHDLGHLADEVALTLDEAAGLLCSRLGNRELRPSPDGRTPAWSGAPEPLIRVQNVHHRYGDAVPALQGVNLSVRQGEVIALVGQNGCGKTTLASHLVGVLRPSNPDAIITVAGLDVPRTPIRQLLPHVNYVFQNPDEQLFQETVAREIAYGLENLGIPEDEKQRRVEAALESFGLAQVRDWPPKELDRGLRTKTAIASVVAMDPEILIIDEPTTGLDYRDAIAIFSVLEELAAAGKTIIFISHEMDLVARFARRVVIMHEGKVVLDGPPARLFAEEEALHGLSLLPPDIHRLCRRLGWPLWDGLRTPADLARAVGPRL
jgi:energy-coupling factor transporter ATP-binding protein EcfA2